MVIMQTAGTFRWICGSSCCCCCY